MRKHLPGLFGVVSFILVVLVFSQTYAPSAFADDGPDAAGVSTQASAVEAGPIAPRLTKDDYPSSTIVRPRVVVWLAAQMHLWFAAFVLAVPIFVVVIEAIGICRKDERYDRMAYEFIRVSMTAYTLTAGTGVVFAVVLFFFYPHLMRYLLSIFRPTVFLYFIFFVLENAALIMYFRLWKRLKTGAGKIAHLCIGIALNLAGTAIMFVANAWVTFMMSPAGVDLKGAFQGDVWAAVHNNLWNPMNLHRFIANIAYGGSIVGAYAAYRFLSSATEEEKAHYDWMGYTANLIAIGALLPLPFAGYWLTAEIYAYSQQMGITLMGGVFAWLFIIQAVIIGALFLAANYYLWCGLSRSEGGKRYTPYIKYIAFMVAVSFIVWFTPHTLILKPWEASALGGQYHPYLGPLGLMPAKNTAVNIMLLFTFLSFLFYRRANRVAVVSWAPYGKAAQTAIFSSAILNIVFLGVYYGYFTNTVYKVASSVPQVATTLFAIIACLTVEFFIYRGAKEAGPYKWGRMPERSQYAIFLITVSFTWLMGLMGYVRAAIRQHWHVFSVVRDASPDAFTPTIGYAANVVSIGTIIFMALVVFIFWLSGRKGADYGE